MTDSFPLLKTPPSALKLIMQSLEIIDILSLSLTSTKTRMSLVPVNHPVCSLNVFISQDIFGLDIFGIDGELKVVCTTEGFGTPGFSYTSLRTRQELWSFTKTDLRLWFLDILRIFNHPGIYCSNCFNETDELEKVVVELLKGIKIKYLYSENLLVARKLRKNADSLRWGLEHHPKQEFLIQNMASFSDQQTIRTKMTIDDLLVSNIRYIFLDDMYFPLKEYNRFLKCWIRGRTLNLKFLEVTRLERFEEMYGVTIDEDNFEERMFKGIPHKKFETSGPYNLAAVDRIVTLSNGFEIRKKNKQRALIEFKPRSFTMIVPRN